MTNFDSELFLFSLFCFSVFLTGSGLLGLFICLHRRIVTSPIGVLRLLNVSLVCFAGTIISLIFLITFAFYGG